MATKVEQDPVTGRYTTGHEWDGIKELNSPLPKWWLYTYYACIVYAVIWWVLYLSWPYVPGYFGGIIGSNQRVELEQRIAAAVSATREVQSGATASVAAEHVLGGRVERLDRALLIDGDQPVRRGFDNGCRQGDRIVCRYRVRLARSFFRAVEGFDHGQTRDRRCAGSRDILAASARKSGSRMCVIPAA